MTYVCVLILFLCVYDGEVLASYVLSYVRTSQMLVYIIIMLMKNSVNGKMGFILLALSAISSVLLQQPAQATLFGQGDFGDSTFGSQSSISMSLSGNVAMNLTLNGGNFEGSGSHTVTVTTNDAVGYRLYAYSQNSTNLTRIGGAQTIPISANSSPAALAVNTWGFNTTGSTTNFQRLLTTPTEIKVTSEPATSGDVTTVTFGVKTDTAKAAGTYTGNVAYTVAARFED